MQYPSLEVGDLISIDTNSSADVLVSEIGFRLIMMPDNGVKDMKPYIEKELQENLVSNHTIVQDIHPVTYFNLSGYEFTTYDGEDYLYTRIILHDGNEIYEIVDMDNKNDYSRDLFEQTINSIKFFD
jgi:hypothetical protein